MYKNMTFLVVDDNPTMRRLTKHLLRDIGYSEVQEADNGETALTMMEEGNVDFLMMSLPMPDMDGMDMIKTIKADPNLKKILILIVLEKGFYRETIIQAVNAGANGYILKPFNAEKLEIELGKIFERS
ncbi:Chemotaxis protein CheY [Marinomonas spartinae]|uniref:response regulator n=1 Tax=Marinomonas spartinae TaxID=1792290 RepID=UPI000808C081|nr:response regulator [Marinomonas spartinae]SBS31087.1 Chemotaxis protein CheY [Marinomonas spartinae]